MVSFACPSTDPFYNLALEEFLFTTFREDDIFLLWRNAPCVVVGSCQNICREVRPAQLRRRGIPVLRRISGGGAVYHDLGNVNYSFVTRQDGPVDYDKSLRPMLNALNATGVPARKNRTCDIAIGGRKISGSAQRSAGGRLLHHGTLLFDSDLTALEDVSVRGKNDCFQTKGTLSAVCPVTNIRPHLKEDLSIEGFMERLLEQMPLDAALRLDPEQDAAVRKLRDEKYRSWEWTWGRTPAFTYERSGWFDGAPFHAAYRARRGVVSDVEVACAGLDCALAKELLEGARLDPEGFAEICGTLAGSKGEDLLDLLL